MHGNANSSGHRLNSCGYHLVNQIYQMRFFIDYRVKVACQNETIKWNPTKI